DRGANSGAGHGSDAPDSADQARVARSRARSGWRAGAASELAQIDVSSMPRLSFMAARNSWRVLKFVRKTPSMRLLTMLTSGHGNPPAAKHRIAPSATAATAG